MYHGRNHLGCRNDSSDPSSLLSWGPNSGSRIHHNEQVTMSQATVGHREMYVPNGSSHVNCVDNPMSAVSNSVDPNGAMNT